MPSSIDFILTLISNKILKKELFESKYFSTLFRTLYTTYCFIRNGPEYCFIKSKPVKQFCSNLQTALLIYCSRCAVNPFEVLTLVRRWP